MKKMQQFTSKIQEHIPAYCKCCGKDFSDALSKIACKHHVFDIREIKVIGATIFFGRNHKNLIFSPLLS